MRSDERLPPVVVESFSESRERVHHRPMTTGGTLALHPPGYELVAKLSAVIATVKQDYARTIGTHRDFRPRIHSHVEHRIDGRASDAMRSLRRAGEIRVSVGPVRLTADVTRAQYDPLGHEYRLPSRLHLPWSWPDLPMWLAVGEVSTTRGALRLSLRSHKRLRYPVRYFHAAHAVLTKLESRLRQPAGA